MLDNVSLASGNHFFKAGAEYNRVNSVQTFIGFANSRYIFSSVTGFLNYLANDSMYVECSDGSSSNTGACPGGTGESRCREAARRSDQVLFAIVQGGLDVKLRVRCARRCAAP